jgi:hypothetical protein
VADVLSHPAAEAEYQDALAWYQARSQRAVTRFEAETERVLNLISSSPEMFPQYDDVHASLYYGDTLTPSFIKS